MIEPDIEGLLARCGLGDRAAFRELYVNTSPKLFGVCLRILGNRGDAEDAVQEAFVKIWHSAGHYQARGNGGTGWLVSIARNQSIDIVRRRKPTTREISTVIDATDPGPSPEWSAIASDERARLDACLEQLQSDRAAAIRSAYFEGHSYEDLSRRFEVPLNTMRTWLRRALISLRKCLGA